MHLLEPGKKTVNVLLFFLALFFLWSVLFEPFPFPKTITLIVVAVFSVYAVFPVYFSFKPEEKINRTIVLFSFLLFIYFAFSNFWFKDFSPEFVFSGALLSLYSLYLTRRATKQLTKKMEKQRIAKTGLYSVTRHPQYFSLFLFLVSVSITLKNTDYLFFSFIFLVLLLFIAKREEKELFFLQEYQEYATKTSFFPFLKQLKNQHKKKKNGYSKNSGKAKP